MEENNVINVEVAEISRINMDGIVDNHLTTIDELRASNEEKDKTIEEKDKTIRKLTKEIMDLKKPVEARFWVKVYKDSDISFLSFHDRGILFSLCQLVGKNKGSYLEDKKTGGIIETWAQLGKNIGIGDYSHTAECCKRLVDKGILIVEPINDTLNGVVNGHEITDYFYNKNHKQCNNKEHYIRGRHFRLNPSHVSIGVDKKGNG